MRRLIMAVALAVMWLAASAPLAAPLVLAPNVQRVSLEGWLAHFKDVDGQLPFETVQRQNFTPLPEFRSLGYSGAAHWFRFELADPSQAAPTRWVLSIGIPELEAVDIWAEKPGGGFAHHALGYHRPYKDRPLQARTFAVPIDVAGHASVYVRVRTHNAINVSAELWRPEAFLANETRANFLGGLYFGFLLIAAVLYLILGAWLRDVVMAAYAGYIASLMLFNLGVTGHLPMLFALDAPWLADVLPRLGWLGGAVAIVLMWGRLLELRRRHPWVHRLYQLTIALNLALLPFALMPFLVKPWLLVFVKLANYLNGINFFIGIALVLLLWWRSRQIELLVYFVAFVIPAVSTVLNTAANLGALAQNWVTSNAYQVAPLVHVLVMSCGLALRLRQMQRDKATAEQGIVVATQRTEEQRRFVAMLSHEFRNPLAAIDRSAQMIAIKTPELTAPGAQRLQQIRDNAATLFGLVDSFLLTEALDHGGMRLSRQPCDIRSLLEGMLRMQGQEAGRRVALTVVPPGETFDLDPSLMGMAVGNLVGNALRYSPPDSRVEVSALTGAGELRIRIADRGATMSEEEIGMLGTPYYRGGSSLGKKGSGLGYYFARQIVEAHCGSLQARARDGGGLIVEVRLIHAPQK